MYQQTFDTIAVKLLEEFVTQNNYYLYTGKGTDTWTGHTEGWTDRQDGSSISPKNKKLFCRGTVLPILGEQHAYLGITTQNPWFKGGHLDFSHLM